MSIKSLMDKNNSLNHKIESQFRKTITSIRQINK
jgi:hypothetical protein